MTSRSNLLDGVSWLWFVVYFTTLSQYRDFNMALNGRTIYERIWEEPVIYRNQSGLRKTAVNPE
jgi:hypothetical protein